MEPAMSPSRREELWAALSGAFVDNEVDYRYIARRVAGVPHAQLREILFNEVAPQCAPNLLAVIPPIWTGFDPTVLIPSIRDMQARNRRCAWARCKHCLAVAVLRRRFRWIWEELEVELNKLEADDNSEATR